MIVISISLPSGLDSAFFTRESGCEKAKGYQDIKPSSNEIEMSANWDVVVT